VYDGGDLLITTRHTGNGVEWIGLDAINPGGPTAQSITASSFTATAAEPGFGINPPVARLTVTPIPEPGTLALFGLGALGLLGYIWKRRKGKESPLPWEIGKRSCATARGLDGDHAPASAEPLIVRYQSSETIPPNTLRVPVVQ
jgi:hypothetical protein